MRHNKYNVDFNFIKEPEQFNKYSEKEFLSYCLGATLYMPAFRDFADIILNGDIGGLASVVICFEDAVPEDELDFAEHCALRNLKKLDERISETPHIADNIPLIFFRVRNVNQFKELSQKIDSKYYQLLTGFVFPKFNKRNGNQYYDVLLQIIQESGERLYGMPILEGREIAFQETRQKELEKIYDIVSRYKEYVLNIRVGGTDFSSCFGVRRGVDYSIYDILTVKDCLADILNMFSRDNQYVIAGPVWEYFLASKEMTFQKDLNFSLQSSVLMRKRLINEAIDGLIREVVLDKANGFVGKTVIHPTHIRFVNAMQAVTEEEYYDAVQILKTSGGVIKSPMENKMNEVSPHRNWAHKIFYKARAYGVIKDEMSYIKLISGKDFLEQTYETT